MSADPTANLQLFSPPASGRSSPAPRASRNAAEERKLTIDHMKGTIVADQAQ
jgi:hypothetical protein